MGTRRIRVASYKVDPGFIYIETSEPNPFTGQKHYHTYVLTEDEARELLTKLKKKLGES